MPDSSPFRGLAHIAIPTKDLDASIAFYRKYLDFELTYRTSVRVDGDSSGFFPVQYALVERGSCVLELLQPANTQLVKAGVEGIPGHFALAVDDLDAAVDRLKATGLLGPEVQPALYPTLLGGSRSVDVTGPSGERIELFESGRRDAAP